MGVRDAHNLMSAADTLPQEAAPAQAPAVLPNPFQGKQYEANLVVDVTPEESERPEDLIHPKRKPSAEEKQTPEPHKRPKTSEDFQEVQTGQAGEKAPEEQETRADSGEVRELQMTACMQAITKVKGLKEEAKRHFSQQDYMKALSKYEEAIGAFSKVLVPAELLQECQSLRAQLLCNIALCCLEIKDFALALKVTEAGVKEFPQDIKLIYTYAKVLHHEGEYDHALFHLKRVIRAHPENAQFLSKIKEIQKDKEEHMSKLKEMYGGKLLPSPPKELTPEPQSSSVMTWSLVAAFAGLAIGGFFLARKYLSRKQ